MPLMTNLYTGVSGLNSSQNAINITAHNLSNVYTNGYVRQQAQFADQTYTKYGNSSVNTMQIGYGVYNARTQHYRDILLDMAYREQSGREGFYTTQYNAVEEIETITGELGKDNAFQKSLQELWSAISEVAKTPDSIVARSGLIMYTETFISRSKEIYSDLTNYQQRLDEKIRSNVDKINSLGDEISRYNLLIQGVEAPGTEQAMDYRDRRDALIDELGSMISISYSEDENGFVTIRAEGEEFVTKGGCFHMSVAELNAENGSTYATPVWPQSNNDPVFNLSVEISTANGNDVGELKGLVKARGGYTATYEDIPHVPDLPDEKDYTDENGILDQAAYQDALTKYWNEDYPAYQDKVFIYNTTVGNSPIMKTQAMFDQLVHTVVETINNLLCPDIETTIAAGTTLTIPAGSVYNQLSDEMKQALNEAGITEADFNSKGVADNDITFTLVNDMTVTALNTGENGASYGSDENSTPGSELFSRSDTLGRYTVATDAGGKKYYIYNPYNQFGKEGKYTIENLEVNQVLLDDYSFLPFSTADKKVDMDLGQKILDAWANATINLDPSNMTPKDIDDYYDAMTEVIANDGSVYKEISQNQNSVVSSLDEARTSFAGVSSNDELTNMIRFKNAYNANSRYINVIADMLDTLINKVGNW